MLKDTEVSKPVAGIPSGADKALDSASPGWSASLTPALFPSLFIDRCVLLHVTEDDHRTMPEFP